MLNSSSDPYFSNEEFLRALRKDATRLPPTGEWFWPAFRLRQTQRRFHEMIKHCAADTGLRSKEIKYLIEAVQSPTENVPLRATVTQWSSRLRGLKARTRGRPRICMLVADGQAARTFLLTDVCRKLVEWADIAILSPLDIEGEVKTLGPAATFLPIPSIRRNRLDMLAGYLGYRFIESPTASQFLLRLEESYQEAVDRDETVEGALGVWKYARGLPTAEDYRRVYLWSLRFFAHLQSVGEAARLLRRLRPDVILNTSSVSWSSRLWTRAAPLAGISVISNVISWDNMSTKTLLDEMSESYLIWSEEMEEDCARSLPFIRDKPRTIVGSPQFEPIVQGKGLVSREEFAKRYGLSPAKKLILYTTGSKTLFPREPECLDALLTHWRSNLGDGADIMVRMHPKDRQGRYAKVIAKFPEVSFTLAGETIAEDGEWVPNQNDITLLVNQLHHCDVIVNVASTLTLEGFVVDKPAINIGFTLGGVGSARYPMDDYYKSRHYRDIVETGAARLVNNYDELFAAIDAVLDWRQFDVDQQRAVLRKKCAHIGDASGRISNYLRAKFVSTPR